MHAQPLDLPHDDAIEALPGIDARIGRASTMGNDRLYRRLLGMFLHGQHDVVGQFAQARAAGDLAAAMRLAHNLRSVSSSLGMTALAERSLALELACLEGADEERLERQLTQITQAIEPVLAGLRLFLREGH